MQARSKGFRLEILFLYLERENVIRIQNFCLIKRVFLSYYFNTTVEFLFHLFMKFHHSPQMATCWIYSTIWKRESKWKTKRKKQKSLNAYPRMVSWTLWRRWRRWTMPHQSFGSWWVNPRMWISLNILEKKKKKKTNKLEIQQINKKFFKLAKLEKKNQLKWRLINKNSTNNNYLISTFAVWTIHV